MLTVPVPPARTQYGIHFVEEDGGWRVVSRELGRREVIPPGSLCTQDNHKIEFYDSRMSLHTVVSKITSNSARTSFSESPRHLLTSVDAVEG